MNNDGVESYDYQQGVIKYSNGELIEGSRINSLLSGKVNIKWENGDRQVHEVNVKWHGPAIIYDFDGKVIKDHFSNGEKIFLL